MIPFCDRSGLPAADCEQLSSQLSTLTTLAEVIRWGLGQTPPSELVDIVTQDEYTHDVILSWRPDRYLVFDAT